MCALGANFIAWEHTSRIYGVHEPTRFTSGLEHADRSASAATADVLIRRHVIPHQLCSPHTSYVNLIDHG